MEGSRTAFVTVGTSDLGLALASSGLIGIHSGGSARITSWLSDWRSWRRGRSRNVDNTNNAVRGGQDAALDVDSLTSISSLVHGLGIMDGESSKTSFGSLETAGRITDRSPVQSPVDIGLRNSHSLASKGEGGSGRNLLVCLWGLDNGRLNASNLITSVSTVVGSITVEGSWNALALVSTLEFGLLAQLSWGLDSAVLFV